MAKNLLLQSKLIIIFNRNKMNLYLSIIIFSRIIENGVETVITEEDGIVKSKTVNGVAQSIEYRK